MKALPIFWFLAAGFASAVAGPARDHPFDILHIAIDITINDTAGTIAGSVTHRFRSLGTALDTLELDAGTDIVVTRASFNGSETGFHRRGERLVVQLPRALAWGESGSVTIDYLARPKSGMYFVPIDTTSTVHHSGQVWTQGQEEENHYWVPLYDYPDDRATSEVRATIRSDWELLSNGRLISVDRAPGGGRTWHYHLDRAHSSYLIMIAAGDYLVSRDTVDGIPLSYWTYPSVPERVAALDATPDIMRWMTTYIGHPYPWGSYAQVVLAEFMYGGMENTSATTLNDYALVDRRARIDHPQEELIAHEIAHQWFGDLVTNRSWDDLWLHESLAEYLPELYLAERNGEDSMLEAMLEKEWVAKEVDRQGRDPISGGENRDGNIYERGARVLDMLRSIIGDELFRRSLQHFISLHADRLVNEQDLRNAFAGTTGLDLDWFFDQWIHGTGYPVYEVGMSHADDTLSLRVRQLQPLDSLTPLFRMPIAVELHYGDNIERRTILVAEADSTYRFASATFPGLVIFDAGSRVMKELRFPRPDSMLIAQLASRRTFDRYEAVALLLESDSLRVAPLPMSLRARALRELWEREKSALVRRRMLELGPVMPTDLSGELIAEGLRDSLPATRRVAAETAYVLRDKERRSGLLRPLTADSSLLVAAASLSMLAATDTSGLDSILLRLRDDGTWRRIGASWLAAVMAGRYRYLAPDVALLAMPGEPEHVRAVAFTTLGMLERTSPGIIEAIRLGLLEGGGLVRATAASAARRLMGEEMRAMLQTLRSGADQDLNERIDDILK